MVAVGTHFRPVAGQHAPGVYRVVGATGTVALLRVGDAEGRRVHTGEIRHVSATTLRAEFEPAESPDAGLSLSGTVRGIAQWFYWNVRRLLP